MARYRRYYTQRNKDGSRTVVSVGPVAMTGVTILKATIVFMFGAVAFFWPLALIGEAFHENAAWTYALGIPAEIVWIGGCVIVYMKVRRRPGPTAKI